MMNPLRPLPKDPLDAFLAMLDLPMVGYLSELERLFEMLKTSGRLSKIPKDELLALAQKVIDGADWLGGACGWW